MLYFYYGADAPKAKQKIAKLIKSLLAKKPDASHYYFDDRSLDQEFLRGLFQSVGLFAEHHVIVLDRVYAVLDNKKALEEMKNSSHVFVLYEEELKKEDFKEISKYSEKIEKYEESKKKNIKKNPDLFALTDTIGTRDKKRAWVLYRELVSDGVVPDQIQPMVFWQVKSMLACRAAKSADAAGVKPFVFNKIKQNSSKYTTEELRELSRKVVGALYNSRQGGDFENELEKVLLSL